MGSRMLQIPRVKIAQRMDNGEYYAIKLFSLETLKQLNLEEGLEIVKKLAHRHLTRVMDEPSEFVYQSRSSKTPEIKRAIIMELPRGGNLFGYVVEAGYLSEETCRYYFKQILSAVSYLHDQQLVHGHLKLENVHLDKDFNIKLTPVYGIDVRIQKEDPQGLKAQMAVDVFQLGILLFIMYTGFSPFSDNYERDYLYQILIQKKHEIFWKYIKAICKGIDLSVEFQQLIIGLFEPELEKRWTVSQIHSCFWLQGQTKGSQEILKEFLLRSELNISRCKQQKIEKELLSIDKGKQRLRSMQSLCLNQESEDEKKLDAQYQLSKERMIKYSPSGIMLDEFLSAMDKDYLFKYLIRTKKMYCTEITFVSPTKYSLSVYQETDGQDLLDLLIELRLTDNNLLSIKFTKRLGNEWFFLQRVHIIKDLILKA